MKRKRRLPVAKPLSGLRVEKDVATGVAARTARPGRRYSNLKLPHERDESTHRPGKPDAVTRQAAQDLQEGKVDTDCYGTTAAHFERKERDL